MELFPQLSVPPAGARAGVVGKNINVLSLPRRDQLLAGLVMKLDVESAETRQPTTFFDAPPEGMFETLRHLAACCAISCTRPLSMNQLDSLEFDSGLWATQVPHHALGAKTNKLSTSLSGYTAYTTKATRKTFTPAPENPAGVHSTTKGRRIRVRHDGRGPALHEPPGLHGESSREVGHPELKGVRLRGGSTLDATGENVF
jgi:hypothetical protein